MATVVAQAIRWSDIGAVFCPTMPADLTPELAVDYLGELSIDLRGVAVLDADGRLLAGATALEDPARELLGAAEAPAVEVSAPGGRVFAVRDAHHAIVAVARRTALPSLVLFDLRAVLADLAPAA
jgi:hypothetical protein